MAHAFLVGPASINAVFKIPHPVVPQAILPSFIQTTSGISHMAAQPLVDIFSYMRAFAPEMGERIIESYPPLHSPADAPSARIKDLLRKPLPALLPFGPFACRGLLVERFSGTDAEENAARIKQTQ